MKDTKVIGLWGANPAVRLNGMELRKTGIEVGDRVTVEFQNGKIIIRKVEE